MYVLYGQIHSNKRPIKTLQLCTVCNAYSFSFSPRASRSISLKVVVVVVVVLLLVVVVTLYKIWNIDGTFKLKVLKCTLNTDGSFNCILKT